jgi:hypothetical protein
MQIDIHKTELIGITRDVFVKEFSELNEAVNTPNLYCIIESVTGIIKYTNTAGYKESEYQTIKIYSHDATDGLNRNGYSLEIGDCFYGFGTYSQFHNGFRASIKGPEGYFLKLDCHLSIEGFTVLVRKFKNLSDSREELLTDNERLISERELLKAKIAELATYSVNFI